MRRLRILPFQGAWVRASVPLANFQKRNVVGQDMAAIGQKGMPGYGLGFTGSVGSIKNIDTLGWFIDPEGHYFISAGSTGINPGGSFARIEEREYIYTSFVPEVLIKDQPDKRIGKASFFPWNLYRRFGENYYQHWIDFTSRRMDDWGLNTISNWSDFGFGRSQRKPYVATAMARKGNGTYKCYSRRRGDTDEIYP